MHIDYTILALLAWMAFVFLGAVVALVHMFVGHAERKRRYTPAELRLVEIMRGVEHGRVRRALGSRAVLPADWKA